MSIAATGATGFKDEFEAPTLEQPGYRASVLRQPVERISVQALERLKLALALYREGRSATSEFYRYLAFYNSLDAAFDNDGPSRDEFIRSELGTEEMPPSSDQEESEFDWADYLRDSLRNAVAHAVRYEGKPVLNPDEAGDRVALAHGAHHLSQLVQDRIDHRWPEGVQSL